MIRLLLIATTLAAFAALTSGCALLLVGAAAGAGAGTYAYVAGELRSSEAVSFDKAWKAAQAAMKDMGYAITETQKDAASAKLVARGSSDKKITVSLQKESGTVTRIGVRVGTMGDKVLSQQIMEKIKSRL